MKVAKVALRPPDDRYPAYAPVLLNGTPVLGFIDSGNTFANVMSPEMMSELGFKLTDLEAIPSLKVNTAANGTQMEVLGQLPRIELQFQGHQKKYRTRPIVLKGLSHKLNISGPFMRRHKIDQIHSRNCIRVDNKEVKLTTKPKSSLKPSGPAVCYLHVKKPPQLAWRETPGVCLAGSNAHVEARTRKVIDLKPWGPKTPSPGDQVLVSPTPAQDEHLGQRDLLQTVSADGTISVLFDNLSGGDINLSEKKAICTIRKVVSTPCELAEEEENEERETGAKELTKEEFAGMTQPNKVKWIVQNFRLDESKALREDKELRKEVIKALLEYEDIISVNGEFGETSLVTHHIILEPGARPIKLRSRPLNPIMEESLSKQLDSWHREEVIEEADSPWSFPLVPVPKKNGKIRWAVDYRGLNRITKKDAFHMPNVDDNLARLSGSNIFSALEGCGAFHVVPIAEEDKEKTAFASPLGQFQFRKMPFGLSNSPATYCRLVQKALRHLPSSEVLCYLDDSALHSKDPWSHLRTFRKVLKAFSTAGMKISPEKAQLFRSSIKYLGHHISQDGISVPAEYTAVVRDWPLPRNLKELRIYLGKLSYYRRFIKDFARKVHPLVKYTKTDLHDSIKTMEKDEEAVRAFNETKEALCTAPVLAYPDFTLPFILDTDFSQDPGAIGAVLSQVQNGKEKVIAYGARRLQERERNYPSTKGEMLAVIFFIKKYRYFLLNSEFLLRTDNKALTWIKTMENPSGLCLRWLEILSNFQFKVQHRAGKGHQNADSLSRAPHAPKPSKEEEDILQADEKVVSSLAMSISNEAQKKLALEQANDKNLQMAIKWITEPPSSKDVLSHEQRTLLALSGQLQEDPDLSLWYITEHMGMADLQRVIVTEKMAEEIMKKCHEDVGHAGIKATAHHCRTRFWMQHLHQTADKVVKECPICQVKSQRSPSQKDTYRPSRQAGQPFTSWSIDILGPLAPTPSGHKYIFTMKDVFSKWIEAFPLPDTTSSSIVQKIEEVFARFGIGQRLHADNATYFTSQTMEDFCKVMGVKLTHSPVFNPQSNSVERSHRDLGTMLRALCTETNRNFEEVLPAALLALRSTVHESTGVSPFFCVFGREATTPVDLIFGLPPRSTEIASDYGPMA